MDLKVSFYSHPSLGGLCTSSFCLSSVHGELCRRTNNATPGVFPNRLVHYMIVEIPKPSFPYYTVYSIHIYSLPIKLYNDLLIYLFIYTRK